MRILRKQSGFTLIEIAIVLVIVAILLGYSIAMLPVQQELKQYRQVDVEMNEIIDQLVGFAQVNGRLPCPDTSGDVDATGVPGVIDGLEDAQDIIINATGVAGVDTIVDSCKSYFGFLPAGTLGIDGDINANGSLQDPWGGAYGYAVSEINADADANPLTAAAIDLVSPNGIREEGIAALSSTGNPPDLFICDDSAVLGNDLDCTAGGANSVQIVGNVAVVIISLGKDFNPVASNIQAENTDDFHDGTNDKVFVRASRNDSAGAEYDDIVKWISPNLLFSKMIEADQLP